MAYNPAAVNCVDRWTVKLRRHDDDDDDDVVKFFNRHARENKKPNTKANKQIHEN